MLKTANYLSFYAKKIHRIASFRISSLGGNIIKVTGSNGDQEKSVLDSISLQ